MIEQTTLLSARVASRSKDFRKTFRDREDLFSLKQAIVTSRFDSEFMYCVESLLCVSFYTVVFLDCSQYSYSFDLQEFSHERNDPETQQLPTMLLNLFRSLLKGIL